VQRGWRLQNFSDPGSGYLASGTQGPFASRVAAVVATSPDVVVLQGGANDEGRGDVAEAARDVIEQLRASLPQARLVLISPLGAPDVGEALREVATEERLHFMDPADAAVTAAPGEPFGPEEQATIATALADDFARLQI
jgi:lysophospholipase L1-like esterase